MLDVFNAILSAKVLRYNYHTNLILFYQEARGPLFVFYRATYLKEREDCMIFSIQQIALGSSESFLSHPINTIAQ